ncbi:MAG: hypothetical protein ABI885_12180 [Gammaproteobacteria bacterium]
MTKNEPGTDVKAHELEVSMEAAAVLLSLAMRDTEHPVADLGGALARIGGSLNELRKRLDAPRDDAAAWRARLEDDVLVCIESLQFHDRLIQQLAAVRNLLASLVREGPLEVSGFGARRWEEMLRMLRERLSADSQHQLFDLLIRTGVVDSDGRYGPEAKEGSIELFD